MKSDPVPERTVRKTEVGMLTKGSSKKRPRGIGTGSALLHRGAALDAMGADPPVVSAYKDLSDFAALSAALSKARVLKKDERGEGGRFSGKDEVSETRPISEPISEPTSEPISEPVSEPVSGPLPSQQNTFMLMTLTAPDALCFPEKVTFKRHSKTVSALEFEASGNRFLSGSHDYSVAYWDFNGMARRSSDGVCVSEPFRYIEPMGAYGIRSLRMSRDSQWVLVAGGSSAVRLFDRNGSMVREFATGDPYIRDLKHTHGHVAAITTAQWVPQDPDRFVSASEDGTVRLWHFGYRKRSEQVITVRSAAAGSGGRAPVTALAFKPVSGDWLVTGSADGSLKLWPGGSALTAASPNSYFMSSSSVNSAHEAGHWISSLCVHQTSDLIASRSLDGSAKIWDVRRFAKPLLAYTDLPALHAETGLIFSADGGHLITGSGSRVLGLTTVEKGQFTIAEGAAEAVSVAFCPKTEQLFTGWTDGSITVHYKDAAVRGGGVHLMKTLLGEELRESLDAEMDIDVGKLYDREAISAARAPSKRKLEKTRADPVKSHRPELPVQGPGQGGRIGSSVTQSIMKTMLKDTSRDADPREALLRYAEQAAKNPKWVAPAYQATQPVPILDPELLVKETREQEERKRRIEEAERLQKERDRRFP
jgi:WD40 repeat protein